MSLETGVPFLDALAERVILEEGTPPSVDFSGGRVTIRACNAAELKHELLHLALLHWKSCGRNVNLAADCSMRHLTGDTLDAVTLPEHKPLEFYSSRLDGGLETLSFGVDPDLHFAIEVLAENAALQFRDQVDEAIRSGTLGDAPASIRLASIYTAWYTSDEEECQRAMLALDDELRAAVFRRRTMRDELCLQDWFVRRVINQLPLNLLGCRALAFCRGLKPLRLKEGCGPGGYVTGSEFSQAITDGDIMCGVLADLRLANCTGYVFELYRCELIDSNIVAHHSENCVLSNSTLGSHCEVCNIQGRRSWAYSP